MWPMKTMQQKFIKNSEWTRWGTIILIVFCVVILIARYFVVQSLIVVDIVVGVVFAIVILAYLIFPFKHA